MKILLINNCHYRRGGADAVYLNTAELLIKKGHEVLYFALDDINNEQNNFSKHFPKSIDFRSLSFLNKISSIKSFVYNKDVKQKLSDFIKENKPDIAHIHLFMGGLTVSILDALKENNIPIIHTVHDYRLICPAYTLLDRKNKICESCKDGFYLRCASKKCSLEGKFSHSFMLMLDAYYRKYFKNTLKSIDKFIFVSQFAKNKHFEFDKNFESKSTVLYNFKSGVFRKSDSRGDYLFFYGRLSREKGIETLVLCAKKLGVKLKIAGTGPLLEDLKKQSNNNIEVLGYKSGDELWNLITQSSYVVVPSEWYENNPLTIVESFCLGKPVIGSNVGGITELIQEERGFLFEPKNEDSMLNSLSKAFSLSNEEYFNMSEKVFSFAKNNFSEEANYESLIKIYNSLI